MVRSSGFGSTSCNYSALFRLAFTTAPQLNCLTSLHNVTRRPVLQKVRHHPYGLCLLVSIRFQVLFHSPPGVLFTFPSQYYTLSVTRSYLALGDGPPSFSQDSTCPTILWILTTSSQFRLQEFHLLCPTFPNCSTTSTKFMWVLTPRYITITRFGLFPFRSPLLWESLSYFLFLQVLRCFSSPGSLPIHYWFMYG